MAWFALAVTVAACGGTATAPTTPATLPATTAAVTTVATDAPDTPLDPEPWALAVVGDFGDGGTAEYEVAAALRDWVDAHPEIRAVVTTGDNLYTEDVAAAWTAPYGWLEEGGIPVWAVAGNHDVESPARRAAVAAAFGEMPGWRLRRVGVVSVVLLDSTRIESAAQSAWLEGVAAEIGDAPWIAVFHHPLHSCGRHGSDEQVIDRWGEQVAGAMLVLNGHDHGYQRFATDRGWSVVTGGGGRRLYELGRCPAGTDGPVAAAQTHHFLGITGDRTGMRVEAIGVDGRILDAFQVTWPASPQRP